MNGIQRMESMMAKKPGFVPPPQAGGIKRLLVAHTASVLADRLIQMVALGVAVASASKAAALSAWILFWATIPGILLAPTAGKVVDRCARTRLMMVTDAVRAFLALGLMGPLRQSAASSALSIGVALVAAAACFFTPARLAVVPNLVKKEKLFQANGWFAASAMVMTLVGTGIGSLLIHAFGTSWTLVAAALMYLTSAVVLSTISELQDHRPPAEHLNLWEGFLVLQRHQAVRRLVGLTAAISVIQGWFYVGVTKLATERLHLDILGFGGLLSALGIGLLIGAWRTHRRSETTPAAQLTWLAESLAVMGAASLLLSRASSFLVASVIMVILGVGTAICLTASDTLFQRMVPDRLRGRLFAARGLLSGIAFAGSTAFAGWIAPHIGMTLWFLLITGVAGIIAVNTWMAAQELNLVYLTLRWILRPIAWWYCRVRRTGLKNIPLTGPVLIAPNHPSRMDAALVIAYAPRRLYFLAAETNWALWWLGWICTKLGCVPVSKTSGNSNAVHTATRLLKQGKAVCIFPEGQISKELGTLKPGVAILAATTGVPVIPVGFHGTYQAMPPAEKLRRHPVTLAVGEPMTVQKIKLDRVPEEVIERINGELTAVIRNLSGQPVVEKSWQLEQETAESVLYGY